MRDGADLDRQHPEHQPDKRGKLFITQLKAKKSLFINRRSSEHGKITMIKPRKGYSMPKLPVLYVCKGNICSEIICFAEIELDELGHENLSSRLDDIVEDKMVL